MDKPQLFDGERKGNNVSVGRKTECAKVLEGKGNINGVIHGSTAQDGTVR